MEPGPLCQVDRAKGSRRYSGRVPKGRDVEHDIIETHVFLVNLFRPRNPPRLREPPARDPATATPAASIADPCTTSPASFIPCPRQPKPQPVSRRRSQSSRTSSRVSRRAILRCRLRSLPTG